MIRHLLKLVWNRKRENAIVIAEIFLSFLVVFFVVTIAATYIANWSRPIGFDYRNMLVLSTDLDHGVIGAKNPEARATFERLMKEARTFPEVESVALSATPPYAMSTSTNERVINGRVIEFIVDDVSDDFLKTMKLELVRGRWFNSEDDAAQWSPFVIDENTASALFPNEDPIGKTYEYVENGPGRIVGVVKPYRKNGETMSPSNMVFRRAMYSRDGDVPGNILVRVRPGSDAAFEERLLQRMQSIAPDLSFEPRSMERMRERQNRIQIMPVITGGIVSLFLIAMVTLGLTGVLWQNVTKRTREIGLRRAIGASSRHVHKQILAEVVLLASVAVIIGAIIVFQLPVLGIFALVSKPAFVFGLVAALATIYGLTILCGLYPSWLASRLQPADALRYE